MKEGFDREIDLLLRRRPRGTAESRLWGDGTGDGAQGTHLDADELSAFAEGALPVAARVAAVSHLADCERCRGVAVGLARVASAEVEVKPQAVVAATISAESERTPAWRALLASLFSPRAMRFAVPVLALSLVGVVSYVALRSDKGSAVQTARQAGQRPGVVQEQPNTAAAPSEMTANANTSVFQDQSANAAPGATPAQVAQPSRPGGHGGAEVPAVGTETTDRDAQPSTEEVAAAAPAPPPPPPAASAEGPADMTKSAPRPVAPEESEAAKSEGARDRSENKEKSTRSSEPADDFAANDTALSRNRAGQRSMNQVQMPDGGERSQRRADNNASNVYGGGAGTAAPPKESERNASRAAGRSRAAREADKKVDADGADRGSDMRSAAGHRFRREGNRWVDVNYRPSMSSTGVRRGTEGFRALVADVPEVGRVAAAIGGEVIVVVGSRAYHVR